MLQRQAGNRAVARLASGGRKLARYEMEGPWDLKDPVHEVLTLLAISRARQRALRLKGRLSPLLAGVNTSGVPRLNSREGHNIAPEDTHRSLHQFLRGVVWADDPLGLLFDEPQDMTNYSSGIQFAWNFDEDYAGDRENLEARSHFGDLQFFHAMASADDESAATVKRRILNWARMLVDIATGRIDPDARIATVPLASRLFPSHRRRTIKQLFGWAGARDVQARQRAVGILFHMIQDSHAHGHVERDPDTGEIVEFHSYTTQSHASHGEYDAWGAGATLQDRLLATRGASAAVQACADVLFRIEIGQSTDQVLRYLDRYVFALSRNARRSGPGAEFRERPAAPAANTPRHGGPGHYHY